MSDKRRVIVIGSGPAGAMTAARLVKKGIPVTLLESGGDLPTGKLVRLMGRTVLRRIADGTSSDSGHVATGDPTTQWFFNLSPGGLSNQWTGAVPRFAPEDFEEGARLHEKYRWPITYEDLSPYYAISEKLLGITGDHADVPQLPAGERRYTRRLPDDWQRIAPTAEACGHGLTTHPIADGGPWMSVRRGTAFNSFTQIISGLLTDSHFELLLGAHVLELEWSQTKRRVTGVVYQERATGTRHRIEGDAVVLTAGALASTKILLNSACADFSDGLGNTDGVLGRYLHDHPKEWWVVDFDAPLSMLGHPAYFSRAPYQTSKPLMAAQCVVGHASDRDKIRSIIPSTTTTFGVQVFGTMVPSEANRVALYPDDRDDFDLPKLQIDIRYDGNVIENMKDARERFLSVFAKAGHSGTIRPFEPHLRPGSSVHYGGTIRMHTSSRYGMLDAWNRLHAAPNVVVSDTSCFTTGVEKNPTLTEMAIAARAADRLADDLRKRE